MKTFLMMVTALGSLTAHADTWDHPTLKNRLPIAGSWGAAEMFCKSQPSSGSVISFTTKMMRAKEIVKEYPEALGQEYAGGNLNYNRIAHEQYGDTKFILSMISIHSETILPILKSIDCAQQTDSP